MNINKFKAILALATAFAFGACDNDVKHDIPSVEAPVVVSTTPSEGDLKVKAGETTIQVVYDKNIFFASKDVDKLAITGGEIISADVVGVNNTLSIVAQLNRGMACTLTIPAGVVTGPNQMPAPEVSLQFSTIDIGKTLVNPSAIPAAQKLFTYLVDNYETKTLSAMMADVSWNYDMSTRVYQWTGRYPAINCFDYGHLAWSVSGANWINYGDITPVKEWSDAGGVVSAMWHWNVPKVAPNETAGGSTTIWSGEVVMLSDWSANVQMNTDGDKALFADAQVGNTIRVAVKDVASGAQGSFKNGGTWGEIASGTDYFDITGDYTLTITEEILDILKTNGLIIGGHDYTATGVYVESEGGSSEPDLATGYAFYKDQTTFDATNATIDGTWENKVFTKDLASIANYLKLLNDEGIPVLWRPFHEAAGGWFWWGKDAASHKALWIAMFNYFKAQGLNNLIWVWTTEGNDPDWYPGDEYVDMIGRDIYEKSTEHCVSEFNSIAAKYGSKVVSLSECGTVGNISEQWNAGARWSWFMPWYDGADDDGNPITHADEAWWKDAMNQDFVVSRDQLPSFK